MRSKIQRVQERIEVMFFIFLLKIVRIDSVISRYERRLARKFVEKCILVNAPHGILLRYDCPVLDPVPAGANTVRNHDVQVSRDPVGWVRIFRCKKCNFFEVYGNAIAIHQYAEQGAFDGECPYCGSSLTVDDWHHEAMDGITYNSCSTCGRTLAVDAEIPALRTVLKMFKQFDQNDPVYLPEICASNESDAYVWDDQRMLNSGEQ